MLLTIDIGNSRIKAAVFEQNTILKLSVFDTKNFFSETEKILHSYPKIDNIVVASVGKIEKTDFELLEKKIKIHYITHKTQFPFQNKYATPQTLGIDRMVLAAGAVLQNPDTNLLIIDTGTCITYDFIDSVGNYLGGAISPGVQMRYDALHYQTAKLPLLKREKPTSFIGNSTNESIHSGVINGIVLEIDGFIEKYRTIYPEIMIILTGGDSDFLAMRLKNTIFANPNFLLESLNQTFQYQKND